MQLEDIIRGMKIKRSGKIGRIEIGNITDDSRKVTPGDLFIAVRGCSIDASKFIHEAIKAGAKAIVSETDFVSSGNVIKILVDDSRRALGSIADNYYSHPSSAIEVIGITGTNGKTTITYLLEGIIKASGSDAGVIGTINYRMSGRSSPAVNTTPGALELQRMLSEIVRCKIGYAVMEVSSHALDQRRVEGVLFDVGIFTNITSDHLDYHKTARNYFNAKKKLIGKLKATGCAILNIDDKRVASLERSLKTRAITYGIKGKADVIARDVEFSMDGARFTIAASSIAFGVNTKLIGHHNVSNILAATAAAIALKLPADAIKEGIESVERVPGRLEAVEACQGFKVFVDFAHTDDALFNVLSILRNLAKNRIVTVFGCGGNRDRTKRPRMGDVACRYSDHVILTSDNPRFEEPEAIIKEIEAGIKNRFSNYDIVADRREAISKALDLAARDDIVLIAGKGHETYQIIKDQYMPFDDRKVAASILRRNRRLRSEC